MTWFAWKGYPPVDIAGIQEKNAVSLGFHGYASQAQAIAHPNTIAPAWDVPLYLAQKAFVNLIEADYAAALSSGEQPGGPNATLTPSHIIAGGVQSTASGILATITQWIGQQSIWLRAAEIIVGTMVVYIGLKAVTAPPGASATQIGKQSVGTTISYAKDVRKLATKV